MSQLRSETMRLYSLTLPMDQHWQTINELLDLDFIHYHDLNSHLGSNNLPFINQIQKLEESLRRLQWCEEIFKNEHRLDNNAPATVEELRRVLHLLAEQNG